MCTRVAFGITWFYHCYLVHRATFSHRSAHKPWETEPPHGDPNEDNYPVTGGDRGIMPGGNATCDARAHGPARACDGCFVPCRRVRNEVSDRARNREHPWRAAAPPIGKIPGARPHVRTNGYVQHRRVRVDTPEADE